MAGGTARGSPARSFFSVSFAAGSKNAQAAFATDTIPLMTGGHMAA